MGRRIAAGIGLLLCALGIGLGVWPRHIDTLDVLDVSCGTPFFPASAPDGQLQDPFGDIFGYDPALDDAEFLAQRCWDSMDEEAYAGMFFVAAGLVMLVAVIFVSWPRKADEFAVPYGTDPYAPVPQPSATYAPPPPPMSEQERYWRQQGWVPAHEVPGPPPGWVRAEPGPEQPLY